MDWLVLTETNFVINSIMDTSIIFTSNLEENIFTGFLFIPLTIHLTTSFYRFTEFGGPVPYRPAEDLAFSVARFIQKGGSFINYYMVIDSSQNLLI